MKGGASQRSESEGRVTGFKVASKQKLSSPARVSKSQHGMARLCSRREWDYHM